MRAAGIKLRRNDGPLASDNAEDITARCSQYKKSVWKEHMRQTAQGGNSGSAVHELSTSVALANLSGLFTFFIISMKNYIH